MAKVNALKNKARREEQRENWSKAIELYTQALDASRKDGEAFADLSLYNRIGDIYLRIGQKNTAVRYYEQAIERYADQDLHTSAIALCNKVLRIQPGRSTVFLQLGRLHLATNLIADARAHYHKYAESMRERGSEPAALQALEELIEDTGDPQTVTLWVTWLAAMEEQAEALERIEEVRSSLIAHGIGPESLIEQVRTGVVEGVEVESAPGEAPDPLAGAFLSTTEPGEPAATEPEVVAEEPEDADVVEIDDDASAGNAAVDAPAMEGVVAAGDPGTAEGSGAEDVREEPVSAADQVVVPEPAPLELGSARWDDEAEELLAELNGPFEAAWAAHESESHDPPPVADERPRLDAQPERAEAPAVAGADTPDAESTESLADPADPVRDRPWADSPDLTDSETLAATGPVGHGAESPARDPDEDPASLDAGAAVVDDSVEDPIEALDRPDVRAFESTDLSFEDVETEPSLAGLPADPIGFSVEPVALDDEIPDVEPAEPPEPDAGSAATDHEGRRVVRGEEDEAGVGSPGPAPIDPADRPPTEDAESIGPGEADWHVGAEAATEAAAARQPEPEVVAVPDEAPVIELSDEADGLVIDPDEDASAVEDLPGTVEAGEVTAEAVADPAPTLEIVSDGELVVEDVPEPVELVSADLEPTTGGAVEAGSTAFLDAIDSDIAVEPEDAPDPDGDVVVVDDSETIAVEVPGAAEPVEPLPDAELAPTASPVGAAETQSAYESLDDIRAPLAEPRLTLEEDPEDAFKDWVDSASLGVLKRALPELENRSETDKALLVIQRLARLEESAVEFKTRLVDYSEKLGRTAFAADAGLHLAATLLGQDRQQDARAVYERVLRLRPGDDTATRALEGLGDVPETHDPEEDDVRPTPYMPDHVGGSESSALLDMPIRPAAPANGHANGHPGGHPNGHGNGGVARPYSGVAGGADASADFEALLSEFRAELHEKPRQVGSSSRTELGASLKEMGRLDDAIRELQAAINEPSPPPLAYELLGEAFLEKGQGRIAVRLLEKALGSLAQGDRELIGVLYQLGAAYESVSEFSKALICYERIFSVDIDYRDIQERIMACSA